MKLTGKGYLIFIALLVGCDFGGYHDLGLYGSRVDAQNNALADILKNYGSLPTNNYYRLKYAFPNPILSAPIRQIEHALWYNKGEN